MHRRSGSPRRIAATVALTATAAGVVAFIAALPPARRVVDVTSLPPFPPGEPAVTLAGAFHVHSRRSDGGGTLDEIAAAAAGAGLDFVILTDHGDGTSRRPASYRAGVLVIEGVEVSTGGGHYVALGLPAAPYPLGGDARGVVEDVRRLGGFGVIAHPASPRPALAWSDWSLPADGVEWLNGDSQWRDDGPLALLRALVGYPVRPAESLASLLARPERALAQWDDLAGKRPIVGLGAADAHARLAPHREDHEYGGEPGMRFPWYESIFQTFAVRVELDGPLSGDPATDEADLLRQLRAGRAYTAIDALAAPVRFGFAGLADDGQPVRMGERAAAGQGLTLSAVVAAPDDATVVLLRNGTPIARQDGGSLTHRVSAGEARAAYRVEVTLPTAPGSPPVPWIVSNPIYAGDSDRASSPAGGAPEPPAPVRAAPPRPWRLERSSGATATLTPRESGIRLAFELGTDVNTFAAAAYDLEPAELADVHAIQLDVEASRPLRVSLQARRNVPADAGARWRRSFYAGPDRGTARVPLDELAPVVAGMPARPDFAAALSLLVVVDTVNTRPGSSGALVLDNLRFEPRAD